MPTCPLNNIDAVLLPAGDKWTTLRILASYGNAGKCLHGVMSGRSLRTSNQIQWLETQLLMLSSTNRSDWEGYRYACGSSTAQAYYNAPANFRLQASLPASASERGENLVWKPNHT